MNLKSFSFAHKLIVCMICSLLASTTLFAVPAYRGWRTVTQPDGTAIKVHQVGDEFFHYWVGEDGKQYKHDAINGWHQVEKATMKDAQKAKRASRAYNQQPRRGAGDHNLAPRGLVILVNFSDVSFYSGNTRKDMDSLMNAANYNFDGATGSTREYYRAQSNGQYVPQFDVVGPYTLTNNRAHYGGNDSNGDDVLAGDMIVEACKAADADGVDFTQYNNDGDSYIDFVYVIYAGAGEADSDVEDAIWPHNWTLSSARSYGNCTYSASDCKVDGLTINNYACSGELTYGEEGSRCGIGTVAHEFGHVIGLPDYYDTNGDTNGDADGKTPNNWTIMDQGSYNNDGKTPPSYSIFDKYYFGWATPTILPKDGAGQNITLTTGYDDAYQITGGTSVVPYTNTGVVYYLENRQMNGWDEYLPGHGLLIWKVKYNASRWSGNTPNSYSSDVLYTVLSADGGTQIGDIYTKNTSTGKWELSYDGANNTFPGKSSVKSVTPVTGCALTEISESAGVISFKYNGGWAKTECTYELVGAHCTVPADGVIATGSTLVLTITPDAGYTLNDPTCWMVSMGSTDLVFGEGFTYDASTNKITIENVIDDVVIAPEGKVLFTITWKSKGTDFATTESAGTVVLPEGTPAACGDGRTFVGWCKTADYEDETTAPEFVQNGDAATSGDIYYAVFANVTEGEAGFEKASSVAVGDKVILVYESESKELSGIEGGSTKYGEGVAYTTTPAGAYLLEVVAGSTNGTYALKHGSDYLQWESGNSLNTKTTIDANSSWTITFSGGNATIKNAADNTRSLQWNSGNPRFACYTSAQKAVQLYKKASGTTYANFTTSCAACDKLVNIIKGTAEHGSFTIDKTGEIETCAAAVVVTVSNITPSTGYQFSQITATPSEGITIDQNAKTVTIAKNTIGNLTINVEFVEKPKYTVNFYDRGEKVSEQEVTKGEAAVVPTLEPVCDGFTFVGWWTDELGTDNTESKSWITDFEINEAKDFYAIYKRTTSGSATTVDDVLDRALTGIAAGSTSYSNWNNKTATSDAVYAGNSAGGNDVIQLRTKNSNSGIITTASGGTVKKVVVEWNSNTSGRTLDVYGKSTAYEAVTDLYNSTKQGTKLGSIASDSQTELTISGDYSFVAFRSNDGAMWIDAITITWQAGSGSTTYYSSNVDCSLIPTAIENTRSEEPVAIKALRNGQIVIIRGEAVYSITGIRIQ
jgi:M6 family metalloprotease-like protein